LHSNDGHDKFFVCSDLGSVYIWDVLEGEPVLQDVIFISKECPLKLLRTVQQGRALFLADRKGQAWYGIPIFLILSTAIFFLPFWSFKTQAQLELF
jgi:hypothetical protein